MTRTTGWAGLVVVVAWCGGAGAAAPPSGEPVEVTPPAAQPSRSMAERGPHLDALGLLTNWANHDLSPAGGLQLGHYFGGAVRVDARALAQAGPGWRGVPARTQWALGVGVGYAVLDDPAFVLAPGVGFVRDLQEPQASLTLDVPLVWSVAGLRLGADLGLGIAFYDARECWSTGTGSSSGCTVRNRNGPLLRAGLSVGYAFGASAAPARQATGPRRSDG